MTNWASFFGYSKTKLKTNKHVNKNGQTHEKAQYIIKILIGYDMPTNDQSGKLSSQTMMNSELEP